MKLRKDQADPPSGKLERMILNTESMKNHARELGFNLVGITRAEPSPTLDAYFRWIDAGMHGAMGYMARPDRQARRRDLQVIMPEVQSLVIVGLDYRTLDIPAEILEDPARGRIASYAWGLDYHDLMTPRLEQFAAWMQAESRQTAQQRVYVDTGAILERSHAQQAGMGFVGKNTMLIHPRRGSYFFLGEIFTSLEFDTYDQPHRPTMCGTCTRCLHACPTHAFPQPHVLDARRCISYLTIENKGWIPPDLRPLLGNWVFGCDICQEVCPFQRFAPTSQEQGFFPVDVDRAAPSLHDLLALDNETFKMRFQGSPIQRIKRDRLVRNACVAAGNWGSPLALPGLIPLLDDPNPLIRGHAAWAISRIEPRSAHLHHLHQRENDPDVLTELSRLLG
ncbi:MAG: tRNA epoxyqueuosine(34) reductase QueG [Anaerolineae bacterium]|nr:tRNA epoxyqueuosine(34) reductase QueG [Anaerolineae bacterium]